MAIARGQGCAVIDPIPLGAIVVVVRRDLVFPDGKLFERAGGGVAGDRGHREDRFPFAEGDRPGRIPEPGATAVTCAFKVSLAPKGTGSRLPVTSRRRSPRW